MDRKKIALWAAVTLLPLGAVAAGTGIADATPFLTFPGFRVPTLGVFLGGALLGVALRCGLTVEAPTDAGFRRIMLYAPLAAMLLLAFLILVGVRLGISGERAAIALILATGALAAALRCIDLAGEGEAIGFESHWGGLGGGSSGWRLFPAAGLALLALAFASASLALVTTVPPPPGKPVAMPEKAAPAASGTRENRAATEAPLATEAAPASVATPAATRKGTE